MPIVEQLIYLYNGNQYLRREAAEYDEQMDKVEKFLCDQMGQNEFDRDQRELFDLLLENYQLTPLSASVPALPKTSPEPGSLG